MKALAHKIENHIKPQHDKNDEKAFVRNYLRRSQRLLTETIKVEANTRNMKSEIEKEKKKVAAARIKLTNEEQRVARDKIEAAKKLAEEEQRIANEKAEAEKRIEKKEKELASRAEKIAQKNAEDEKILQKKEAELREQEEQIANKMASMVLEPNIAKVRYCIRTLPRGGMYWVVHPRRPRDFPRPSRCPEGEA